MKQGKSTSHRTDYKTEPKSTAVNPAAVDQMGQALGTLPGHRFSAPQLFEGHGYNAPKGAGKQVHKCGSQGRH